MAIKPKCDKCNLELQDFGAILLSPPDKKSKVQKFHLCKSCYTDIAIKFGSKPKPVAIASRRRAIQ